MNAKPIRNLVREHQTLFIILIVGLFLLELEIFALAAMKSGRRSWLQVMDAQGHVIHETSGKNLSEFNKHHFEKTFGPLENYQVRLETRDQPFPFRAWLVAAVAIPVGAMLLLAFVVKAVVAIFHGGEPAADPLRPLCEPGSGSRLESFLDRVSRMNIFIVGFLVFIAAITYWVLPNLIMHLGRAGMETVMRFKWVFIAAGLVVAGVAVWIVYLRYLLAKKSIDSRTEVEKHRLSLEYQTRRGRVLQLDGPSGAQTGPGSLDWEGDANAPGSSEDAR